MNKLLKTILFILNILMLVLAVYWFMQNKEPEPLIVMIGQIVALVALLLENSFAKINNKRVSQSGIKIEANAGDKVKNSDIEHSTIDIKINK